MKPMGILFILFLSLHLGSCNRHDEEESESSVFNKTKTTIKKSTSKIASAPINYQEELKETAGDLYDSVKKTVLDNKNNSEKMQTPFYKILTDITKASKEDYVGFIASPSFDALYIDAQVLQKSTAYEESSASLSLTGEATTSSTETCTKTKIQKEMDPNATDPVCKEGDQSITDKAIHFFTGGDTTGGVLVMISGTIGITTGIYNAWQGETKLMRGVGWAKITLGIMALYVGLRRSQGDDSTITKELSDAIILGIAAATAVGGAAVAYAGVKDIVKVNDTAPKGFSGWIKNNAFKDTDVKKFNRGVAVVEIIFGSAAVLLGSYEAYHICDGNVKSCPGLSLTENTQEAAIMAKFKEAEKKIIELKAKINS